MERRLHSPPERRATRVSRDWLNPSVFITHSTWSPNRAKLKSRAPKPNTRTRLPSPIYRRCWRRRPVSDERQSRGTRRRSDAGAGDPSAWCTPPSCGRNARYAGTRPPEDPPPSRTPCQYPPISLSHVFHLSKLQAPTWDRPRCSSATFSQRRRVLKWPSAALLWISRSNPSISTCSLSNQSTPHHYLWPLSRIKQSNYLVCPVW